MKHCTRGLLADLVSSSIILIILKREFRGVDWNLNQPWYLTYPHMVLFSTPARHLWGKGGGGHSTSEKVLSISLSLCLRIYFILRELRLICGFQFYILCVIFFSLKWSNMQFVCWQQRHITKKKKAVRWNSNHVSLCLNHPLVIYTPNEL